MQALVLKDKNLQVQRQYPDPKCPDGEVLIAVKLAGICSTDLELAKGYMNFNGIPGHEFVGTVVKGPRNLLKKRVVGEINCVCGKCDMCQSGLSHHCRKRSVLGIDNRHGAFAQFLCLPQTNVLPIPDALSDEQAVFVEPLAAAFQIIKQVPIESRNKVIVIGDGRLGLLAVQVLAQQKPQKIVLLGKHHEKLTFAEKRGIQGIHLDDMLITPEWDLVVDCTGSAPGFALATRLVRPRGRLVLKSTWAQPQPVDLSSLVVNEITLIGSRCGPFPDAINALAAEKIIVNGLVTARLPLDQAPAAFKKAAQPQHIKVLLDIPPT